MKSEDWLILKTLYTTKNLTQASRLLFVSQPALTKRLQYIEQIMGCKVVQRNNRGVFFTAEGQYLAERADDFLNLMEETQDHLRSLRSQTVHVVRVGAPSSFVKYYLVDQLAEFYQERPDISIQIRVYVSSEIPNCIHTGAVDCGFIFGDIQHSLTGHLYDTQQCYAVYREPISLEDLPNMPMVMHNLNESTQQAILQWWKQRFPQPPNIGIHVNNLDTALDMVANSLGYCIAFGTFLEKRPDFFLLPLYNVDKSPFMRNTWLLYSEEILSNAYVKQFVSFILSNSKHPVLF